MTEFDAELHLRLRGEQALRAEDIAAFDECARVLAALELLDAGTVHQVVALYRRARALRGSPWYDEPPEQTGRSVPDYRVVNGDREISAPFGRVQVHYLALAPSAIRIAATLHLTPQQRPGRGPGGPHFMPFHPAMPGTDLRDDQGRRISLSFNGGGSSTHWTGAFVADEAVAPGTRWVEFLGERIELIPIESGATTSVETLGETVRDRALAYLRFRHAQAATRFWDQSTRDAAVDTVRAAGVLTTDDLAAARARTPTPRHHHHHPHGGRGVFVSARPIGPVARPRRPTGGREGRVLVGVTTPVVDGIALSVLSLTGERGGFGVELQGATVEPDPLLDDGDLTARVLFTASDDRGNSYSGEFGEWSEETYGDFGGTLRFEPGIDPSATRLTLELTTRSHRATVTVPLRWTKS